MSHEYLKKIDAAIGDRIDTGIRENGLQRKQLSVKADISSPHISEVVRGRKSISASKLYLVARALNRPVDWFFEPLYTDYGTCPHCTAPVTYHTHTNAHCRAGHVFPIEAARNTAQ